MNISPRTKMLAGFLFANIIVAIAVMAVLRTRPTSPPQIQGVLLQQTLELPEFSLLDHHNRAFTRDSLKGRWHLVSYGFTTCPDICPTTLSQLTVLSAELDSQGYNDLDVLFYTVDHRRDTAEQMASYVPFFSPDFLGLTHLDNSENPHLPFEKGLGIFAELTPVTGPGIDPAANEYQVNHGVTLFLINPEAELQAIFQPDINAQGVAAFNPQILLQDYLAIRKYLGLTPNEGSGS